MATKKILGFIGWTILIVVTIFIIAFIRECNDGFGYRAGSGLGSLVDIGGEKHKPVYLQKYADTFFVLYPQYKVPKNDPTESVTSGYEFLNLTKFYFGEDPKEIYCVQWEGTGFISVRFAYSYRTGQTYSDRTGENADKEQERERMSKRLKSEILDRIDSIISISKDKDSTIYTPGI